MTWRRIFVPRRPIPLKFISFFVFAGLRLARESFDLICTAGAIVPNRIDVASVHYCHAAVVRKVGIFGSADGALARRLNTGLQRTVSLAAERWSYRGTRAHALVAVSEGLAAELRRFFPSVPVTVVPNGVDNDRFCPAADARAHFRMERGVAEDDVVVLFVGGDWDRKGLAIAIEAVARAATAGHHLRLWVVGNGDRARYAAIARAAGVGESVTFFGPRPDTERFYRAADVFVLPSQYEALPLAALEALAAGLPIVATPVNGISEIFSEQQPGLIVDRTVAAFENALSTLQRDPEGRRRMGSVGRAFALQQTWQRSAEGTLELFRAILSEKQRTDGPARELVGSRR